MVYYIRHSSRSRLHLYAQPFEVLVVSTPPCSTARWVRKSDHGMKLYVMRPEGKANRRQKVSKRPASLHPRVRKGREIGNPPCFSQCRKESICRKTCCFKYLLPFLSSPIAKHTETNRQTISGLQITLEPLGSQRLLFTLADYQHLEG